MIIKALKSGENIQLFDTFIGLLATVNETTWEIIKAIKKEGVKKAVKDIACLFEIDEKIAKEDIYNVIGDLKDAGIKIEDISLNISNKKYVPRSIEFLITSKCNSNCIYCQNSHIRDNKIELSTEKIKETLNDLSTLGTWCVWLECGGVLLRKDIFEILGHTEKLELASILFISGINVTEEIAKKLSYFKNLRIQVDIDSCIPEHHDLQRGLPGAFEKTIEGIKNLKKYGITPHIAMIITKYNIDDIEKTADFVNTLGVKYLFVGPTGYFFGRAYDNRDKLCLSKDNVKKLEKTLEKIQKKYEGKMCISLST